MKNVVAAEKVVVVKEGLQNLMIYIINKNPNFTIEKWDTFTRKLDVQLDTLVQALQNGAKRKDVRYMIESIKRTFKEVLRSARVALRFSLESSIPFKALDEIAAN